MQKLRCIWGYCRGNKWRVGAIVAVVLIYVVLNLLGPLVFSFLIDNVIHLEPITNSAMTWFSNWLGGVDVLRNNLWIGALLILVINAFICLCVFFRGRWNAVVAEEVSRRVRNDLYQHLQQLPYSYHVSIKTGDLVQRCTSDVDTIRRFLAGQASEVIYSAATALIAVLILFSIYPPMAWLAVISMPILVVYAYIFFTRVQKAFLASDESEGDLTAAVQENLSGIRVVKAFGREAHEIERFEKKNRHYRDLTFKMIQLLGAYWGTSDFICLTQIFVIVIAGIFAANQGQLSVGNFFVFISYEGMILWPVRNLGRILADMGKMSVSIGRLQEILHEPVEDTTTGQTPVLQGNIIFDHVSFAYQNEPPILQDVSFTIPVGKTVALIGPTGSGKSSLVHLLMRLYDPTDGKIWIDGHDLTTIQRKALRQQVGIVLQEPFLFSKTIYDNIQLANPKANKSDVVQAATIASVHEVITQFDRGYDTLVGEKGVTLSGGQKQRIAIARTIIAPTPILIFDDSLSAVDTQTDAEIRAKLAEVQEEVTTLIITQRVASSKDADIILVLEEGKITQQGTHEQLIHQEGLYQRIYQIQTARMEGGQL